MDTNVIELAFSDPKGHSIEVWAVYYGPRLMSVSFASSPFGQVESVDFPVKREWF